MSITVDKTARVDANAELGDGCTIGAYCTVGPYVTIGQNTKLVSHVVVDGYTTIGSDCKIYPFTTIGLQSQDLKYVEGQVTYCVIGDNNIIREHVSIHAATEEHTTTRVGSNCALLAQSHVGHNCTVGDYVILSHASALGGHVLVGDRANIGGLAAVHQFCNVGEYSMVGGMSCVLKDVLPFAIANGNPATIRGVNKIGMQRGNLPEDTIRDVQEVFKILYLRDHLWVEAIRIVEDELGHVEHVQKMLGAIADSERGIANTE